MKQIIQNIKDTPLVVHLMLAWMFFVMLGMTWMALDLMELDTRLTAVEASAGVERINQVNARMNTIELQLTDIINSEVAIREILDDMWSKD
ncbi:MAG: hypothetical protein HPY66_1696 [Firmicutes bacterium]|nr:hypothetical protein [Bacillota bacterium]